MSSTEKNVLTLVEHIMDGDVFNTIPGRRIASFPNMPHNLMDQLDQIKLNKTWISDSLKKFHKKHFYKIY